MDNAGEDLAIGRSLDVGLPAVRFELIEYDNTDPWPTGPDGTGSSLARVSATSYGNEPGNWSDGGVGGSPGVEDIGSVGDLDGDGTLNVDDINQLIQGIQSGVSDDAFDIDGSGVVDTDDIHAWLAVAGNANIGAPYLLGDTNLDGVVDGGDLDVVASNWQQSTTGWSQGDFNADGFVDAGDLNAIGKNFLQAVPAAASAVRPTVAPLAIQIDAVHATPVEAVIPTEIMQATVRRPERPESVVSTKQGEIDRNDQATLATRYLTRKYSQRQMSSKQDNVVRNDFFSDLTDGIFANW